MTVCPHCPTKPLCERASRCEWKARTGHVPMPDTDDGWIVPAPWLGQGLWQWGVTQTAAVAAAEQARSAAIRDLERQIAEWRAVRLTPKAWDLKDVEADEGEG